MSNGDQLLDGLGPALKHLRTERGLRQGDLAEASGVAAAQISTYESGKGNPRLGTLEKLLIGLGAEFSDLDRALQRVRRGSQATSRVQNRQRRSDLGAESLAAERALSGFLTHLARIAG